jgi:3-oxoacyl-[acyl-carrier-protein] synthase-3
MYVPEDVLTNSDLCKMVDTSDEWIITRTGISERRISKEDVFTSDVATKAALAAIGNAKITPNDIDIIIVATVTPDMYCPSVSCIVQKNINARGASAFDLNAACTGFIYGITVADQFLRNEVYKNALIIGADCLSKITEYKDKKTCVLFGDGAGAVILQARENCESKIVDSLLGAEGSKGENLTVLGLRKDEMELKKRITNNCNTIWMNGSEVFKFAVNSMVYSVQKLLKKIGKSIDEISYIIPHQANQRIIDGACKKLNYKSEKMFSNVQKYGNMSTASIPVAFYEALNEGKIKNGDLVILTGFGGGLTWGSVALII